MWHCAPWAFALQSMHAAAVASGKAYWQPILALLALHRMLDRPTS